MATCLADVPLWLQRMYFQIENGDHLTWNRFHVFFYLWEKWHDRLSSRRLIQSEFTF